MVQVHDKLDAMQDQVKKLDLYRADDKGSGGLSAKEKVMLRRQEKVAREEEEQRVALRQVGRGGMRGEGGRGL